MLSLNEPTRSVAVEGDGLACHVAVNDDGVCWSLAGARTEMPVTLPQSAFRRAASWGPPASADGGGIPSSPLPSGTFTTIAEKQVARGLLRSRQARPPAGTVTFLDRRTLRTSTHDVTVHPYDVPARQRTQDEFQRDLRELRAGQALGRQELARRWQRLSDERFGAFAKLADADFRQLPLKVALARLSDPCGLPAVPATVVGAGPDREGARERAMLSALAAYGSIVVDPRLLIDGNGAFLCPPDGDAARSLQSVRDGSVAAFARAVDLTHGRERLVPARQAFAAMRTCEPARLPCGTSAGLGWRQALAHGLLQHCVRLTILGSSFPERRPAALAVTDFGHDPGVHFLTAMVKAAGIDLTLHDITGPAGVPVVACASADEEMVYGGGAQLAEAVAEALTAALFQYQLRRDPALRAAASTAVASASWTNPASSASLGPDRLVRALTSLGYTPSVIALNHDQAVHEAFPYVLLVTLEPSR